MKLEQTPNAERRLEAHQGDLEGRIAQLTASLHQTETELRAKQLQCASVLEVMSDAILVAEPNGRICDTNPAACRMHRCDRSDLIGRLGRDLIDPADHAQFDEAVRRVVTGASSRSEMKSVRFDDSRFSVELQLSPLLLSGDSGFLAVLKEMPSRDRSEKALPAGEERFERFRNAIAEAPFPIMIHAEDGEVIQINHAWTDITGYGTAEIPTIAEWTLRAYGDRSPVERERIDKRYELTNRAHEGEHVITTKGGERRVLDFLASPLGDLPDGRRLVMSVAMDVTERSKTLEALHDSRKRFQTMVEDQTEFICRWLPDGTLTYVNEAYCRYFEKTREELIGRNFKLIIPETDISAAESHIRAFSPDNPVGTHEHRVVRGNGTIRWHQWTNRGFFDSAGKLVEFQSAGRDVTDRRSAEEQVRRLNEELEKRVTERTEELQSSRRRYQILADVSPVGIFHADSDGRCTYLNRKLSEMTDLGLDQARDDGWHKAIHEDDRVRVADEWREAVSGNVPFSSEFRLVSKDGTTTWVFGQATMERDGEGRAIGWVGTITDMNARKKAEQDAAEAHRVLTTLMSNLSGMVYRRRNDPDWTLEFANDGCEKLTGYPVADLISKTVNFADLIHPADRERMWNSVQTAIKKHDPFELTYRIHMADGRQKWVWDQGRGVYDAGGQLVALEGYLADVTGRKQAEEALRASESLLADSQRVAHVGYFDWNIVTDEIGRSNETYNIFGLDRKDLDATHEAHLLSVHPDDRSAVKTAVDDALSQRKPYNVHYRIVRPDGAVRFVHEWAEVTFGFDGKPLRMLGIVQDITERRQAEEALQRQEAELAHLSRVSTMGELAAGLAHELNQPLSAIMNYGEATRRLLQGPNLRSDKLMHNIERIGQMAERAGKIIRRLRDFVGRRETRRSTLDVNRLIGEVANLIAAEGRYRNIALYMDLAREPMTVMVDAIQIQQVIINLVHNAMDTLQSQPSWPRRVTLRTSRLGADAVAVAVEDNGPGIAQEVADNLFQPFVSTKPHGLGMGLPISQSIIRAHKGRLWATPNDDGGATFRFTLPIILSEENQ